MQHTAMDASPQTIRSETSILDLNDDCLKEVFAQMAPEQLAIVADVCTRFRENTMHSAREKCKKIKLIGKPSVLDCSKLRNFGQFIEWIEVDHYYYRRNEEYELRIFDFLNLYCFGESIKLQLTGFNITREVAVRMQPLLGRVQRLRFERCRFHELILSNLSSGSPQLCELICRGCILSIGAKKLFVLLQPTFPKLVSFSYDKLKDSQISDFEKFLQQNPQLKEIDVENYSSDDVVFQLIAKYVPTVEKIRFDDYGMKVPRSVNYVGRLRDLKSLYFGRKVSTGFIQSVLREIAFTNIALEHLNLSSGTICVEIVQFIERISNLQTLKTLQMTINAYLFEVQLKDLRKHLIGMYKRLKELSKMWLSTMKLKITEHDLLELVQNAEKLQTFVYDCPISSTDRINISADTFKKLVETIERRPEKTPLTLYLPKGQYIVDIPVELNRAHCGTLKFKIEDWRVQQNYCDECEFKGRFRCFCF